MTPDLETLETLMTRLPEPVPPPALTATVMARIAREVDGSLAPARSGPARDGSDRLVWIWTLAGFAVVFCVTAWWWPLAGSLTELTSPKIGGGIPDVVPMDAPVAALLGLGMLVYLTSLFAPLRSRR